jgi:Tol biopolymer transport system component
VTFDPAIDQIPVHASDGARVIFSSNRKGTYDLYERAMNATGTDRLLFSTAQNKFAMGVSRDGRFLIYRNTNTNTDWDVWALPLEGEPTPQPVATTAFQEMMGEFSPGIAADRDSQLSARARRPMHAAREVYSAVTLAVSETPRCDMRSC